MAAGATALRILATGGTFDKIYDPATGKLGFAESHLPGLLAQARVTLPTKVEIVFLLDSLDMQDTDRKAVLAACVAAPENAVVVVHGTDTMRETARVLGPIIGSNFDPAPGATSSAGSIDSARKTVVLTGAMVPCSVENSDALFNLGFACACAQTLPPGVYAAMNGRIFNWDKVAKNRAAGSFEESE